MKRIGLVLGLILIFVVIVNAECKITEDGFGVTDELFMYKMTKVVTLGGQDSEQAMEMLMRGYREGTVIVIPKGTVIEKKDSFKEFKAFSRIRIKGIWIFVLDRNFLCNDQSK